MLLIWFDIGQNDPMAFARAIAAAEREACAKVCEQLAQDWRPQCERDYSADDAAAKACAAAIRARGESRE